MGSQRYSPEFKDEAVRQIVIINGRRIPSVFRPFGGRVRNNSY